MDAECYKAMSQLESQIIIFYLESQKILVSELLDSW